MHACDVPLCGHTMIQVCICKFDYVYVTEQRLSIECDERNIGKNYNCDPEQQNLNAGTMCGNRKVAGLIEWCCH